MANHVANRNCPFAYAVASNASLILAPLLAKAKQPPRDPRGTGPGGYRLFELQGFLAYAGLRPGPGQEALQLAPNAW